MSQDGQLAQKKPKEQAVSDNRVSQLKTELVSVNRQMESAKSEGNKPALNKARARRLEIWRELRDDFNVAPPPYIAKDLEARYAKAEKKKEQTEFAPKAREEKKPEVMVFTPEEVFGQEKKAKPAPMIADNEFWKPSNIVPQQSASVAREERVSAPSKPAPAAKKQEPSKKEKPEELKKHIYAWLGNDKEYRQLVHEADYNRELAGKASARLGGLRGEERLLALDDIFLYRHKSLEAERKIVRLLDDKKAQFEKENGSNPALVRAYTEERDSLHTKWYGKFISPFSEKEQFAMNSAKYDYHSRRDSEGNLKTRLDKVRGKNRLQAEMKRKLLEKARDLIEGLEEPTAEEMETMDQLRGAASNSEVGVSEMLKIALGENVGKETVEEVELALLANTVDDLETRVALAEKKPPKAAPAEAGKGPVKVASLSEREKKES